MELYLLKSSACLFVFVCVYMLFLEQQKLHVFKRFYLLIAVIIAFVIPLLTLTHYIEPVELPVFEMNSTENNPLTITKPSKQIIEREINYLPILLWVIYGVGVGLFLIRFIVNIVRLNKRINQNEVTKQASFFYVLLEKLIIPHSFFNYIFLNKSQFEANTIPKEVLLHEETHAKQWHSLDIIWIELLQIVLWFHPLVYVLKYQIKLNHEFLADAAVLNQGTDTKHYQSILLQFSSSSTAPHQLSSAINYSSIKKRFTVMKTQTSKTKRWLSTLLLIPIIAILFYAFAEKEYVEKDYSSTGEAIQNELEEISNYDLHYLDDTNDSKKILGIWYNEEKNISFQIHLNNGGLLWDVREADKSYVRYYPKISDQGWYFTYENDNLEFEFSEGKLKNSRGLIFKRISNQPTSQNFRIILNEKGDIEINNRKETLESFVKRIEHIKNDLSPSEIDRLIKITIFSKSKHHEELLQKIVNMLNAEGFNDLDVLRFYKSESEKPKLSNFLFTIEKNGNTLELRCESGCRWSHLTLNTASKPYIINDFGFSEGKTLESDKFTFSIQPNTNGVELNGIKGTAWVDLAFSLQDNKKQAINANGMTSIPLTFKKEHPKKVLTIQAVNNSLIINGKTSSINTYVKDFDAMTKNWTPEDYKHTELDLKTENCSKDFLERLNEIHKKTDHFLITVLGIDNPSQADKSDVKMQQINSSTGFHEVNGQLLYYTHIKGEITHYNRYGVITDKNGKEIVPGKQESAYDILPNAKVTKIYKDDKVVVEFKDEKENLKQYQQQKATAKQVELYNKLAKHYNESINKGHIIIKMKDVEQLKYIYNLMTKDQRKKAEPFPNFPKPPPPPPAPAPPQSVSKSNDLMSPPPPPPSPLDLIIEMAKANAKFYYESKEISSDKAIALIKEDKTLNISVEKSNTRQPVVYISKK